VQPPPEPPDRAAETGTNGGREAVQRWRLVLRREALPSDLAQRDLLTGWESTLAESGLPIAGLDMPKPKARFAIAAPLASGIAGEAELADLWLVERTPRWRVREALSGRLPTAHALVDLYDVWLGEPALPGRVAASVYRASLPGPVNTPRLAGAAEALLTAETLPRERRKGDGTVSYDLRLFLVSIDVAPAPGGGAVLRLTLRHDPARGVGRPDEALAALGQALGDPPLQPVSLVREALVLADPPPPAPPAPRGPRRQPAPRSGLDQRSPPPRAGAR